MNYSGYMTLEGARKIANILMENSQYVEVVPLPDDNARVSSREDNRHVVEAGENEYPPNPEEA